MKKKILITILILTLFTNTYADRYIKVASINFEYIFKRYSATKLVRKKLLRLNAKVKKRIDKRKYELKKLQRIYNLNKHRFSELERRWRFSEIKIKNEILKNKINHYKKLLITIERKYTYSFVREIYLAAKKIARKKGFSIVLTKKAILHVDAAHNLDKYVLLYLERKLRGERRE